MKFTLTKSVLGSSVVSTETVTASSRETTPESATQTSTKQATETSNTKSNERVLYCFVTTRFIFSVIRRLSSYLHFTN